MSTRSIIATVTPEGKCKAIYCHFDGYPEGVGQTLLDHYKDQNKINDLIALGGISSLAEEISCPEGHSFETRKEGYTVAYHRDRGEDLRIIELDSIDELKTIDAWQDYTYLWDGEKWLIGEVSSTPKQPLTEVINPTPVDIYEIKKDIANFTIDLMAKGYGTALILNNYINQGMVTEKIDRKKILAELPATNDLTQDLLNYRGQLETLLKAS